MMHTLLMLKEYKSRSQHFSHHMRTQTTRYAKNLAVAS